MGYVKWERKEYHYYGGISYMQLLDGTPFSYNNIANSGERVQFKNRVYVYDCCCLSSPVSATGQGVFGRGEGDEVFKSFQDRSHRKTPGRGMVQEMQYAVPPNASATSVSTRANVLRTQGQGLRRRNRAGRTVEDTI